MHNSEVIEVSRDCLTPDHATTTPADALIEALSSAGLHVHPGTWDLLVLWVINVERRVSEQGAALSRAEAHALQLGYALEQARAERNDAQRVALDARKPDATTAALERKVAAREAARAQGAGETAYPSARFHRCGGEIVIDGQRNTCRKCGSSWLAQQTARPQSPWVPDDAAPTVNAKASADVVAKLRAMRVALNTHVQNGGVEKAVDAALQVYFALNIWRGHVVQFDPREVIE